MEWPKNITSDITAALEKYGITDFLIMGLQDVPGSDERRDFWSLSMRDKKEFAAGLSRIFAKKEGPATLIKMIFEANDIQRKLEDLQGRIQREPGEA